MDRSNNRAAEVGVPQLTVLMLEGLFVAAVVL
jgi:hypothetical protein